MPAATARPSHTLRACTRFLSLAVALGGIVNGCGGHLGTSEGGGAGTAGAPGAGGASGGGGTVGSGGTIGTGGTADAGGGDRGPFGEPACLPKVAQGGACTPMDQQFCYKPCGPEMKGVRSETCRSSGLYAEMDGCSYDPTRDYACYRIPVEPDSACAATPQAGAVCDVPACRPCNSRGGIVRGEFFSAAGAATIGWCVCQAPDAGGKRTWSCANAATWPCPLGSGC
jgi:hypothetical protein